MRPSRRAVRLSIDWQAPTLCDPPERERPGAGDTGAELRNADAEKNTPETSEAQAGLLSDRERDDHYQHVVARLSDKWRVIVCKDGIQWVLQRGRAAGRRGDEWKGFGYFLTREALIRVCARSCGHVDPAQMAILRRLPEYIVGGAA